MNVGIDLGTTNSIISCILPNGNTQVFPDVEWPDQNMTPSSIYLAYPSVLVGRSAEIRHQKDPKTEIIKYIKRRFGSNDPIAFDSQGNCWMAEGLAALLLRKMQMDAMAFSGEQINRMAISVPAHFDIKQRRTVLFATHMTGMTNVALVDEPVAAALHYGYKNEEMDESNLLVYDLGGGTFDATVIHVSKKGIFVLAKEGINDLGGKEFDELIMDQYMGQIEKAIGKSIEWSIFQLQQVRLIAEQSKIEMAFSQSGFVRNQILFERVLVTLVLDVQSFFAKANKLIEKTVLCTTRCLTQSGVESKDVHSILMVGGSSQLPRVARNISSILDFPLSKIRNQNPMFAVSLGASLFAEMHDENSEIKDLPICFRGVSGHYVGIQTRDPGTDQLDTDILIEKNLPLPCTVNRTYFTTSADQKYITLILVQKIEKNGNTIPSGKIQIGPLLHPRTNYPIEVVVQMLEDGTLSVKAIDPMMGKEVHQTFTITDDESRIMHEQKVLVEGAMINSLV